MGHALRAAAQAPTYALAAPLILAVAVGLTGHHLRTRKNVIR